MQNKFSVQLQMTDHRTVRIGYVREEAIRELGKTETGAELPFLFTEQMTG